MHHRFVYPVLNIFLDLKNITTISDISCLIGYNKFRILTLSDRDYLEPNNRPWIEKVRKFLGESAEEVTGITVLTTPRLLGYVFNPVSFYFCSKSSGEISAIIVEINNTFGERHLYLLNKLVGNSLSTGIAATHPKAFYVSPFNDLEGDYEYKFKLNSDVLELTLNIRREGEVVFRTGIKGRFTPFTHKSLLTKIVTNPLRLWSAMPLILWQAAKLYYHLKLPVKQKPIPANEMTFVSEKPAIMDRLAMAAVFKFLEHVKVGHLILELPNRETREFGDLNSTDKGVIIIHEYSFFRKIILHGDIGFGEAFTEGLWDTPNLTAVITLFIKNEKALTEQPSLFSKLGVIRNRWLHLRRRNTPVKSRENIKAHYDLSNEMFKLFLDESMMYSSGIYPEESSTLQEAQQHKIHKIIEKAEIKPTDHVLEIGSGWGGFAIAAVKATGCRVTTITLSTEQKALAEARIEAEGLSDKIEVKLIDYRHVGGSFDKVISIEMIEAVGSEFLGDYFAAIERLLKPGGIALIQAITIPDSRYDTYCKGVDWIQKHIFPGSHIPSIGALNKAITSRTKLTVTKIDSIGPHYARTLKDWRDRFNAASQDLTRNGFGVEFQRAWNYYFSYCEAGFATAALDDIHLGLRKPT